MTGDRQKTDIEGTRRTRNHRPIRKRKRKRKRRCYGHKGKKKTKTKEKGNACKGISIDRGGVKRCPQQDLDGLR